MADARPQRRLAAILAADVVGYSRLMEADEAGTLSRLRALRTELFAPATAAHGGRIFKTTGDGALVEFASAVGAVESAIEIQRALALRDADLAAEKRIALRIGISLGDVIVEGADLYGNGVNVAARLEGLAEPGGICVSGTVHDSVGRSIDVAYDDLGEQPVKNIEQPVRAWRVRLGASAAQRSAVLPLGNRPAIAVLPFDNLSGDPEQEYFSDGLTEDIITALSLWRSFPVIARNSTFAYKGKATDIRRVAEELGAAYVLEGSVRKAGNRVRVAAQLIDAGTGHHLWAENLDRDLVDIFDLQDELTRRIAATVVPELERIEPLRVRSAQPGNLDAWDLVQRGLYDLYQFDVEAMESAREKFERAAVLDPFYSMARTGLAWTYVRENFLGASRSREETASELIRHAQRAVELDATDSMAHFVLGVGHMVFGQFDLAVAEAGRATDLNPSNANAFIIKCVALIGLGQGDAAIESFETALRLNPRDPRHAAWRTFLSDAHLVAGRYQAAADVAAEVVRSQPEMPRAHVGLAAALGLLGRRDEARAALATGERLHPGVTKNRADYFSGTGSAAAKPFVAGLRAAGWTEDAEGG